MRITIDNYSGFCFGVVYAIQMAEEILRKKGVLYCLGDIVHNDKEVDRLNSLGLKIINHKDLKKLKDCMKFQYFSISLYCRILVSTI